MSDAFRELLKKVGSGSHTSKDLTRQEAADAMRMMLLGEATPAQIGAFLISHRIKRPTGEELAGMLDAYDQLGLRLQPLTNTDSQVIVLGIPYDGRSRTAPVSPITALILTTVGQPVVMHGGGIMPTKYGIPLIDIWQGLGVNFRLSCSETQQVFETTKLGFVYLPLHFPLTNKLVEYRDQLGKRPPLATMELMWSPYAGVAQIISGFVHPPTETMFQDAHALRGQQNFTTVKGLEGSCDLPRDRTAIIGIFSNSNLERLHLHPRDYGFAGKEVPLESFSSLISQMQEVLQGKPSELMQAAIWNGGFYLWRCGVCKDLESGFTEAENLLTSGKVAQKLAEITQVVNDMQLAHQV
ncbi:MAG TPA: anthranilate phosphoribosyltransferase family protein [Oculatellaceae cyanobacterium]